MPKVGTRSYTLIVEDRKKKRSVAIEPPTEIQFDITMAMFTQLSIGYIKIYNPDAFLKDFLMYKYSVGDKNNQLFIEFKPMLLGQVEEDLGNSSASQILNTALYNSYSYSMTIKAYVYQTTLMHPNAKDEYIHLQLLTSLWNIFSENYTAPGATSEGLAMKKVKDFFKKQGYPISYSGALDTRTSVEKYPYNPNDNYFNVLKDLLKADNQTPYIENDALKIAYDDPQKGKGSKGRIGSYNKPYEVSIDNGLMTYVQQVNNNAMFRFTLDHQFPLDSYVSIPKSLINRQLVTPSISGGAGSLQWLLGAENKYRVLSYRLVGDYFDPATWYQEVTVQAGNMPLAANLQSKAIGVS